MKTGALIKPGETMTMPCKPETVVMKKTTPVVFKPITNHPFEAVLLLKDQILSLKKGTRVRTSITITNVSNTDVKIPEKMLLGTLQPVMSMTPAPVKFKQFAKEEQDLDTKYSHIRNLEMEPALTTRVESVEIDNSMQGVESVEFDASIQVDD